MCENAADGVSMQCGQIYGFYHDNSLQASDITTLNIEDLKLHTSNNWEELRRIWLEGKQHSEMEKLQIFCRVNV